MNEKIQKTSKKKSEMDSHQNYKKASGPVGIPKYIFNAGMWKKNPNRSNEKC